VSRAPRLKAPPIIRAVSPLPPRGVWVTAGFFVVSGILEFTLSVAELDPITGWTAWEAFVRGGTHLLLAVGLWRRYALARSVALVYCLAALVTYGFVLVLALLHEPVQFPVSVRVQSLVQVPSCALLLPFLRSAAAGALFPRALFGPHRR